MRHGVKGATTRTTTKLEWVGRNVGGEMDTSGVVVVCIGVVTWLLKPARLLGNLPTAIRNHVGQVLADGCRNGKTPLGARMSIDISMALQGHEGGRKRPR